MTPQFHLRPISGFGAASRVATSNVRSNKHAHHGGFVYSGGCKFAREVLLLPEIEEADIRLYTYNTVRCVGPSGLLTSRRDIGYCS